MSGESGRLTYTVDQPDVHGQGGGWQVKQVEGLQPDEVEGVLALVAPLRLEDRPPEFLTEQQAAALPRRLVYAHVSDAGAALAHTAPAGMDASRRPDNTFTDALLLRQVPPSPPIRWWRSSGWLTPYGPVAVSRAAFAPGSRPEPGDVITALDAVEMLADRDSGVDRPATFFPLLDAVAAAVRGGRRVALLVPDPDTAALWLGAVSFFAPPAFAAQITFDTWGSPAALVKRQAPCVLTAVLRREAEPILRELSPAYAVFDVEHVADDESGRDACGSPVAPTLWSRIADLAFDLPPDEVVGLLDLVAKEQREDPGEALAAAARAYPRLAGVGSTIDRFVQEAAAARTGPTRAPAPRVPAPAPAPPARTQARDAGADPAAAPAHCLDALVAADIAGNALDVARALQQFFLAAAENVDLLAVESPAPVPAPVTAVPLDIQTRIAANRLLLALPDADPPLGIRGFDLLVRCGLINRGTQASDRFEPVVRRLAAYWRTAASESGIASVGPIHPVTEHLLGARNDPRPALSERPQAPAARRSPRDAAVSLSAALHDPHDGNVEQAWDDAAAALHAAAPTPETRLLAGVMRKHWRDPRIAARHGDDGGLLAVLRAHDLVARPWDSAEFDLAPDAEELLSVVPELARHLSHEKPLWMGVAKAGTLAVAHLAVAHRRGVRESEALYRREVAQSYVEVVFDGYESARNGLSALVPTGIVSALVEALGRRELAPDVPFALRLLAAEPRMPEEVPLPRPRTLAGLILGSLARRDTQVMMRHVTGAWADGSPHSPAGHLSEDEQHVRAQINARDSERRAVGRDYRYERREI